MADSDQDVTLSLLRDAPYEKKASLDVPIGCECRGYTLLQKMGWRPGDGLGRLSDGRVEPVPLISNDSLLGLGKASEYDRVAVEATETRKATTAETLLVEEADDRAREARQERNAHEAKVQVALKEALAEFYCTCCNKQYQNAMEMDNHLSSYDHHHVKRFKEMKEVENARKRQEREAKDARKLAKAARTAGPASDGAAPGSVETQSAGCAPPRAMDPPPPPPAALVQNAAPLKFSMPSGRPRAAIAGGMAAAKVKAASGAGGKVDLKARAVFGAADDDDT
jgi:hypothetical protein